MSNVYFKRGSQANIEKYLNTYTGANPQQAVEGAFYLTEDTNRLYIGKEVSSGNIKAVPVNQGVYTVNNVSDLPVASSAEETGGFYYVINGNILAIATNSTWVQINSFTNTDNYIAERTDEGSTSNGAAVIEEVLFNTNNAQLASTLEFAGSNGSGFTASFEPKYSLARYYSGGITYYIKNGNVYQVATTQPTSIASNNSTYYVQRGYRVVFTPSIYSLSATIDGRDLTLTVEDNAPTPHSSNVVLTAGNNVSFTSGANGITIASTDTYATKLATGAGNGPSTSETYGTDGADGTNGTTRPTYSQNGFHIKVYNSSGRYGGASIDPLIQIGGEAANQEAVHFVNGTAVLPVYTKTEVDNKMRTFNAMEYQGLIDSATFPPSNPHNGYVWMASSTFTIGTGQNQKQVKAGDLIITQGTEDVNGIVQSPTWDIITSGTAWDTTTTYTHQQHGFSIGNQTAGGNSIIGTFQIAVNSYLNINDNDTGTSKLVTVGHAEINPQTVAHSINYVDKDGNNIRQSGASTTRTTLDIPVPVVSYDAAGHITGITTYTYQVVDTHATVTNSLVGTSASSGTATLTSTVKVDGADKIGAMELQSSTIKFSANSGNIIMNIEWDTFN